MLGGGQCPAWNREVVVRTQTGESFESKRLGTWVCRVEVACREDGASGWTVGHRAGDVGLWGSTLSRGCRLMGLGREAGAGWAETGVLGTRSQQRERGVRGLGLRASQAGGVLCRGVRGQGKRGCDGRWWPWGRPGGWGLEARGVSGVTVGGRGG